jgi:hypothetical protein
MKKYSAIIILFLFYGNNLFSQGVETKTQYKRQLIFDKTIEYERFCIRGYFNEFLLNDLKQYKNDSAKGIVISVDFPRPKRGYICYYTDSCNFPATINAEKEYIDKLNKLGCFKYYNKLSEISINNMDKFGYGPTWKMKLKDTYGNKRKYHCAIFAIQRNSIEQDFKSRRDFENSKDLKFKYNLYPQMYQGYESITDSILHENDTAIFFYVKSEFKAVTINYEEIIIYDLKRSKFISSDSTGQYKTLHTIFYTKPSMEKIVFYSRQYDKSDYGWTKLWGFGASGYLESIDIPENNSENQHIDFFVDFDKEIPLINSLTIDNNTIYLRQAMGDFRLGYESGSSKEINVKAYLLY